jgi:hypothetical protein
MLFEIPVVIFSTVTVEGSNKQDAIEMIKELDNTVMDVFINRIHPFNKHLANVIPIADEQNFIKDNNNIYHRIRKI